MIWVLNLDAEDELGHVGAHTPARGLEARVRSLLPALKGLIGEGAVAWPVEHPRPSDGRGAAWCPTRWALDRLAAAGVEVPPAPSMEVLRKVNHRHFSHALGTFLPGAAWVTSQAELDEVFRDDRWWLLKRPLGYAGKGRKRIFPSRQTNEERAWIASSLKADGLQVEPWVERELDCGLHGLIDADGTWRLGRTTIQHLEPTGAWRATTLGELERDEESALRREGERTAHALIAAGYFGPFGIDGFRWRDSLGVHFQPRSEINARYSMGWSVGMSPR